MIQSTPASTARVTDRRLRACTVTGRPRPCASLTASDSSSSDMAANSVVPGPGMATLMRSTPSLTWPMMISVLMAGARLV